mgnify:CR=1 FL=1
MKAFSLPLVLIAATRLHAADEAGNAHAGLMPDQLNFFEKNIRPVLVEHCYKCHSSQGEKGVKGGLALDTRAGILQGGDSGPVIVPGRPDESLLVEAIGYADEALQMPPKGKLSADAIADLRKWVMMGAPDASEIVSRIAGASSSDSARSASNEGYSIPFPAFSAAFSASTRFCFSVLSASFR